MKRTSRQQKFDRKDIIKIISEIVIPLLIIVVEIAKAL